MKWISRKDSSYKLNLKFCIIYCSVSIIVGNKKENSSANGRDQKVMRILGNIHKVQIYLLCFLTFLLNFLFTHYILSEINWNLSNKQWKCMQLLLKNCLWYSCRAVQLNVSGHNLPFSKQLIDYIFFKIT